MKWSYYPSTVFLAARKSRTLQLLAFDEKSTLIVFLLSEPLFICGNKEKQSKVDFFVES
jgi:hypothetical protein